ncbi:dTDP-glucose 4,6-dehydratase [Murinocardiopsis flavida]|uniref:dTDP-glucose 4,6-dehydratase n=1 Tax=Murinocardiopsis flavida TaxID=645275 RepID=A0A2P8CAU8_9ACTN|nr:dTDP-glucose 4,6-dehydratase [Murinocardiopsis flavida]PSK82110.1 dTDP-glucose 4,6-dehydratase [Murinocardiopsis flavida]
MRILVTGGAGFIGSNYVRRLLEGRYPETEQAHVTVVDKLAYPANPANLDGVADPARLDVVRGDITDRPLMLRLMRGTDLVVHFAAEPHVDRSIAGSADFIATNVVGTHNLLQCALETGVDRFVHVSTDEVYGSIAVGSWEETRPLEPGSPYSASKASADLIAGSFHRTHGLDVRITRCTANYGPRQSPAEFIPRAITRLLHGMPVPLDGEGANVRDWLHVDDHCRAVALVAAKGRPGEVYNIGGGAELTNRELTGMLLDILGADWSMVRRVEDRLGHDLRFSVDHRKIGDELGYRAEIPLERGLADTVGWYLGNRAWWEGAVQAA